jgi:hypothetical protein
MLLNFSLSDLFVGEGPSPTKEEEVLRVARVPTELSEQSFLLLILGVRLTRENLIATEFLLGEGGQGFMTTNRLTNQSILPQSYY